MFEGEKPESVFEIGCGGAALLKDVATHFACTKTGGIDISKVRMSNAKNVLPDGEFIVHDLNDPWPIADKSYDIVFSVGVLMYLFDPLPVIKEMLRVAKDKIIVAEYHGKDLTEYGALLTFEMNNGVHATIARNYIKLFRKLGGSISMRDLQSTEGKTIFKRNA